MIMASCADSLTRPRSSSMDSWGPGTKSWASVTSRCWPLLLSRTRTACSSSTTAARCLPPSSRTSCGPRKTWSGPATTRMSPDDLSRTLTYSFTLRSTALILSASRAFSSGPGKMVASPRCVTTLPVTVSTSLMNSYFFSTQAFLMPLPSRPLASAPDISICHVGSRKTSAFPLCTQRRPVSMSFSLRYSSSCSATASHVGLAVS
mmetsp:Transcript_82342/g.233500  ORF Transcript_82342/g.233500 Transcript_82342/m.233500 type:complete len:205 (+) Transcript_82342:1256-1870(+)